MDNDFKRFLYCLILELEEGNALVTGVRNASMAVKNESFRFVLESICEEVENGSSVVEAFKSYADQFPILFIDILTLRYEQGGTLIPVLQDYLDMRIETLIRNHVYHARS